MDNGTIHKVWGERSRILLSPTCEIDHLKLKKQSFCSLHSHKNKINLFYVLKGKVKIETEYGQIVLKKGQSFKVAPPLKHRFIALERSEMIECAFVLKENIDDKDINRIKLGGKIIKGQFISIPELRKKGYLELNNEE